MTTQFVPDLAKVYEECRDFHHQFETLLMATCNAQGEADASYAPYIEHLGDYYVYVSELAVHTPNLQRKPQCSVLFIEEESQAKNIFARRRLTLNCQAQVIARNSEAFEQILSLFTIKFGKFMEMLKNLKDFHLFKLHPEKGAYVAGFAQAYTLEGEGLAQIRHRNEVGHRKDVVTP